VDETEVVVAEAGSACGVPAHFPSWAPAQASVLRLGRKLTAIAREPRRETKREDAWTFQSRLSISGKWRPDVESSPSSLGPGLGESDCSARGNLRAFARPPIFMSSSFFRREKQPEPRAHPSECGRNKSNDYGSSSALA
jgi:hypothetical protein